MRLIIYTKNIIANLLVLVSGYILMVFLRFFDEILNMPTFHPQIFLGIITIFRGGA